MKFELLLCGHFVIDRRSCATLDDVTARDQHSTVRPDVVFTGVGDDVTRYCSNYNKSPSSHGSTCSVKAAFHYSSQLQTWFSTRFAARFSTSSCGFATRFRLFLSKTWSRTAAGSLVRARARQMECRKKPVLSKFAAGFRHAFDLLATRFSTRFAAG